jgi:hypothetical protein
LSVLALSQAAIITDNREGVVAAPTAARQHSQLELLALLGECKLEALSTLNSILKMTLGETLPRLGVVGYETFCGLEE